MKRRAIAALALLSLACGSGSNSSGDGPGESADARGRGKRDKDARATASNSSIGPATSPTTKASATPYRLVRTTRIEQLIGDVDKTTGAKTANQSETRFQIGGTDLGYSFEHAGAVHFLFGDTIPKGGDPLGRSTSTDASNGITLDFMMGAKDAYLRVHPVGEKMAGFEVPVSGISLDGTMFVVCKLEHGEDEARPTDVSVLTKFQESPPRFERIRELSRLPEGKFSKLSMLERPTTEGTKLPWNEPTIFMWGTGIYRKSSPYLSVVSKSGFETGRETQYFAGVDASGAPLFSPLESRAVSLFEHPTMGDISVTWSEAARLFVMTYDSREPQGILLRTSPTPWGSWSEPVTLLDPTMPVADTLRYRPKKSPASLAGPIIARGKDPLDVPGGFYAPYVISRFTAATDRSLSVTYVLSTWNPYVVVLMRSELAR